MARIARQCRVLGLWLLLALLTLLLLAPAKAGDWDEPTCEVGLAALVETGQWPAPDVSGGPKQRGYETWHYFHGLPMFWFIGNPPGVSECVDRLLFELRARADGGDLRATRVLGALLPGLARSYRYYRTLGDLLQEARREGHDRLRSAAEAGDNQALWILWGAYYGQVLFLNKDCGRQRIDVPPILELLAWLEEQAESNDPSLLLELERVAINGRCIAADPYRAIRYRERWQELSGSADELCKGDLARCNYQLDYHGPHLRQR